MTDIPDFAAEAEADAREAAEGAGKGAQGAAITELVQAALALKDEIEEVEAQLKNAKADLEALVRRDIPARLDEIGVPELTVMCGNRRVRVAIDNKAFGSFNYAPDQDRAVELLNGVGFEGGVLTRASVDLKDDELHLLKELGKLFHEKFGKDINVSRDIHHSTLRAFVKQALENNPGFDANAVGVTIVREAQLKPLK